MIHNLHRLPTPLGPAPKLKVEHVLRLQPNGGGLVDHLRGSQSEDSSSSSDDGNQPNNISSSRNQRDASRRNNHHHHHHHHSTVPKTLAIVESDEEENEHLLRLRRKSIGGSTLMSPKHKPAALPISAIQGLFTNTTSAIDPNNSRRGKKEKVKVCSYIMRRVGGGGSSPPSSSPPNHHHTSSPFSPTMSMTTSDTAGSAFNNSGAFGGTTSSMAYSRPGTTASSIGGSRVGSRAGAPPTAYRHAKPFGTFSMGSNSTLQPPNLSRLSPALQRAISPAGVVTPIMLRAASSPCPRPQGIAAAIPSLQVSAAQQQAQAQLNSRTNDISSSSLQISLDAGYHTPFEGVPPLPSDFDHVGGCSQHIARFEQRQQARIDLDQAAVAARQISVGSAMSGMMQRSSSSLAAGGVSSRSRTTSRQHSLPLNAVTPPPVQPSQPPFSALTAPLHEEHVHIEEAVDRPPTHPSVLSSIQEQYTLPANHMGGGQQRHHRHHQSHHYRGGGDPLNSDGDGGGYGHGYDDDDEVDGGGEGDDVSRISPHGSEGGWSGDSTTAPDIDADGRQLVGTLPRSAFQPPRVIKMLFNFTAVQRLPSIAILRKVGYPVLYERLLGASNKRRSSVSRQHYFNVMKELVPQMPVKDAVAILDCVDRTEHGDVDVDVLLLSVQMLLGSATPGDVLRFCIKALDPQSSEPRYISRYEIQSMLRAVQQLSTLGTSTNPISSQQGGGGRKGSAGKPSLPSIVLTPGLINSAAAAVSKGGLPDTSNRSKSKNNSITGGGGSPTPHRRSTPMALRGSPSSQQHKKTGSGIGEASEEAVDKEYTVMFAGISELLQDANKYDRHGQMPLDSFIAFLKDRLRLFGGPVVSAVDRRSFTGSSLSAGTAGRLSDSGDRVRPGGRVMVSGAAPGQGGRGGVLDGARLIAPAHRLSSKVMILQHVHDSTTTGSSHTTS